jgi:peptide/nickel transport system permease protein/oligopeptide transport system permease protein
MKDKSQNNQTSDTIKEVPPKANEGKRIARVMFSRWVVTLGAILLVFFLIVAIFGPIFAPYDPYKQDLTNILQQPDSEHIMGTDALGRDEFSRVIYGARISLMVGVIAITIAAVLGMLLGLLAGYFGGIINMVIMRLIDALMSLPPIVLMMSITIILGGGLVNVMIAIGIGMMPTYTRLMCGQVLTIRESDYVTAANVSGASDFRIMFRHLLPNAFPPLLVLITLNMGSAIMLEAMLSFLGMGIQPPEAAWGSMVDDGYRYLISNPILSFAPGIAIMIVVLAFNLVGDGLRDALDPRLRGTL